MIAFWELKLILLQLLGNQGPLMPYTWLLTKKIEPRNFEHFKTCMGLLHILSPNQLSPASDFLKAGMRWAWAEFDLFPSWKYLNVNSHYLFPLANWNFRNWNWGREFKLVPLFVSTFFFLKKGKVSFYIASALSSPPMSTSDTETETDDENYCKV